MFCGLVKCECDRFLRGHIFLSCGLRANLQCWNRGRAAWIWDDIHGVRETRALMNCQVPIYWRIWGVVLRKGNVQDVIDRLWHVTGQKVPKVPNISGSIQCETKTRREIWCVCVCVCVVCVKKSVKARDPDRERWACSKTLCEVVDLVILHEYRNMGRIGDT